MHRAPRQPPWNRRSGLTILELLVTSSVISLLTALLLPSVMSAREAARRLECTNHLRQLGLALHNYHDLQSSLPAAWQDDASGSAYGWGVPLLPYLDQQPLFTAIDRRLTFSDPQHGPVHSLGLPLFRCPSDVSPATFELFEAGADTPFLTLASANYLGVYGNTEPDEVHPVPAGEGTFINQRPIRFSEISRGLSETLFLGERSASMFSVSWLGFDSRDEDAECRVVGNASEGPNCTRCDECEFSSRHPGVSQFLFGDGHVKGLSDSIDQTIYRQLARRHE
ncbi:DUF1559 family PulG-like putative transporter [Planctomicrobium sp. SH664]|uniref:DUF1559 family PulG-like putative transporter n=1 Tax=Planctomicrobium sp. SH664 TaxID=3448125 RepID=UPI003F5B4A89